MIVFVAVYLGVLNLLTFAVFGFDKAAAADKRSRVPERALLTLAALGGGPGAPAGPAGVPPQDLASSRSAPG